MPLQPISIPIVSVATSVTQQRINQVNSIAAQIIAERTNGIPARPATPARTLPNGQQFAGSSATPAVTPADLDAAYGEENLAVLNILGAALAQTDTTKLAAALAALQ